MTNIGNELTDPKYNPKIMHIAIHPDDEVWIGGTIYKSVNNGCDVDVLLLTHGSTGYEKLEQKEKIEDKRLQEMKNSQKILGFGLFDFHNFLDDLGYSPEQASCIDGEVQERNKYFTNGLIKAIREIKPTSVLVPYENDTHPDHRNSYEATIHSIWRAERPSQLELGKPHQVKRIFQYEITNLMDGATHLIDITGEPWEKVKEAMACHKSQLERDLGYQILLADRTITRGRGISNSGDINEILKQNPENFLNADKAFVNYVSSGKAKRAEALKATPLRKFW